MVFCVPTALAAEEPGLGQGSALPDSANLPIQSYPPDIRFDFNLYAPPGLPSRTEGNWHVRPRDLDPGNMLLESENKGAFVGSTKRFFVR